MPRYAVTPATGGAAGTHVLFGGTVADDDDRILVGRLNEQGALREVWMDVAGETVLAIFGKRGSGKSYTLGVVVEGLAAPSGESSISKSRQRRGALLLDTLNVFWSLANPFVTDADSERFEHEGKQLKSWGITPPTMNVDVWVPDGFRRPHTPESFKDLRIAPHELSAEDLADLIELDIQRDLMGQLLAEARDKAAERYGEFSLQEVLDVVESDEELAEYYAESTIRGLRQRLRAASQLDVFQRPGTPLAQLLQAGKVNVVELGEVPNALRAVITSVLLRRIHSERAQASDAEKQLALNTRLSEGERQALRLFRDGCVPPSWVLIDEAQNVLPATREVKSSDAVVRFVREGRNFGLSFALTTQQPSAVDQRILAQADSVICHKLTVASDIARMRDNLKSAEPSEVKLGGKRLDLAAWLRSLEPGSAIVTNTETDRVFALEVRPRVTPHGGTGFRPEQ